MLANTRSDQTSRSNWSPKKYKTAKRHQASGSQGNTTTLCVLKLATRSACPAAMTGNILLCRDLVLRSWVPKHCQTESWRYDMSSELSLRLSPQRLSDRRASTWANMSRGLCHTSPTHRYLLLWQLMGHSGNYVWSLGGRVGVVLAMCSVFWQSSGDAQAGFVDTWCDPRER